MRTYECDGCIQRHFQQNLDTFKAYVLDELPIPAQFISVPEKLRQSRIRATSTFLAQENS